MRNYTLKNRVIRLRKEGRSYNEISVKCNISKSTVRSWCKNIILTSAQINKIKKRHIENSTERLKLIQSKRRLFIKTTRQKLNIEGTKDVTNIKDPLFFVGLGLYWGEGSKRGNQEIGIVNSDYRIIKVAIKWFFKFYNIQKQDLIARLTLNETFKGNVNEFLCWWAERLDLNLNQFTRTHFSSSNRTIYTNSQYKGVVRIKIKRPLRIRERILSSIETLCEIYAK